MMEKKCLEDGNVATENCPTTMQYTTLPQQTRCQGSITLHWDNSWVCSPVSETPWLESAVEAMCLWQTIVSSQCVRMTMIVANNNPARQFLRENVGLPSIRRLTIGRPTQLIMYIPFQVNIFQKSILLIVQYKYLKSFSEDLFSKIQQKSDPLHKIMRYFIYYSTQLASSFPPGRNLPGGNEMM